MAQDITEKVALLLAKAEGTDQDTYIIRKLFVLWHGEGPWPCCFCEELVLRMGGNHGLVHHINGEHKDNRPDNVSAAHHGCHTQYHNRDNPRVRYTMKGKKHSEETKQKIREKAVGRPGSRIGAVLSDETKQKLSIAAKNRINGNGQSGRKRSDESKARMRAAWVERKRKAGVENA